MGVSIDLRSVYVHLSKLQNTYRSFDDETSALVLRLEEELRGLSSTALDVARGYVGPNASHESLIDPTWVLFDEASLQFGNDLMAQW